MIQWTRKKMFHLFNVYAYDVSYADRQESNAEVYKDLQGTIAQLGRVPWVLGADFNQTPEEPLAGWFSKARVAAPDVPTILLGGSLIGSFLALTWEV